MSVLTTLPSAPADLLSARGADTSDGGSFGFPVGVQIPGSVPLIGGLPAPDALPARELADAFTRVLHDPAAGRTALQYSVPLGIPELRSWVAAREGATAENAVITNGALHGLALLFEALIDAGDVVAVENPTYPFALRLLQFHGAGILPLTTDEFGLDVDAFESTLIDGARPKAVYVIPDFQNPSGITLPADRRLRLVGLAERYGFLIISDNPYKELRFAGDAIDDFPVDSDFVVRVNTFSKTLGPGLRLGWTIAPTWLVPALGRIRQSQDQHASLLTQRAVVELVETPTLFDSIAGRAQALYRERSTVLREALLAGLGDRITVAPAEGGLFLWGQVHDDRVDPDIAQQLARQSGTDYTLGRYFDASGRGLFHDHLRFAFSTLTPEQLRLAAERVVAALSSPAARR